MNQKVTKTTEGWTWLLNADKFHYFVDGRSLCSKYMLLGAFDQCDPRTDADKCAACRKKLSRTRKGTP